MRLLEFIEGKDKTKLSSYRLMFLLWGLALLFLVCFLTIKNGTFPVIDISLIFLYGSVIGGKVVQSFAEKSSVVDPILSQ